MEKFVNNESLFISIDISNCFDIFGRNQTKRKMIHVEKPDKEKLMKLGVSSWPIWTKEESEFPWEYDEKETCYILKGDVVVMPENGEPVHFGKGDLVVFPEGLKCTWKINKAVKKHYKFG